MTILLLVLGGWVLLSLGLGGLWMWAHRPRPESLADAPPLRAHASVG